MTERRLCRLQYAAGRVEDCPEDRCPFWEPGGAALTGRCAIEQVDLQTNGELAHWLVELRAALEEEARPSAAGRATDAWRLFYRLVDSGVREFTDSRPDMPATRFSAKSDAPSARPRESADKHEGISNKVAGDA